jgi:hypothetical protein
MQEEGLAMRAQYGFRITARHAVRMAFPNLWVMPSPVPVTG